MGKKRIPEGTTKVVQDGIVIYYENEMEAEISEVTIDVRKWFFKKDVVIREFLMK